jgi:hypothetical protein
MGTAVKQQESKKALVISVSDYKYFPALTFCKKDGEEMVNVLKGTPFEYQTTPLIGKIAYRRIRDMTRNFFLDRNIKAKDTLLFYFSGHGVIDNYGDHYLTTFETDPEDPGSRGLSFQELEGIINNSYSTRIAAILDCCYAGAA